MKIIRPLLLVMVLGLNAIIADSPTPSHEFVFAVSSPGNTYYAVQTIQPKAPFKGGDASYRFQVFETATGKLFWERTHPTPIASAGELFLADDGEHFIQSYPNIRPFEKPDGTTKQEYFEYKNKEAGIVFRDGVKRTFHIESGKILRREAVAEFQKEWLPVPPALPPLAEPVVSDPAAP